MPKESVDDEQDHLPSIVFKGPQTLMGSQLASASSEMQAFQQAREEFKSLQAEAVKAEESTPPPPVGFLDRAVDAVVAETQNQMEEILATTTLEKSGSIDLHSEEIQTFIKEVAWSVVPTVAERILRQEILKELDL